MAASTNPPGRAQAHQMNARTFQTTVVAYWTGRCKEVLQDRKNLLREDLEYTVETVAKLRDERLKACVAELIGWSDDDRAELETFCAIALEVMKDSPPSRLREAALKVELRYHLRDL